MSRGHARAARGGGDVRLGGAWSPMQSIKNHALYAGARAGLVLARPLPAPLLRWLGRALGTLVGRLAGRRARANLARALPNLSNHTCLDISLKCFENIGGHCGDLLAILGGARLEPLPVDPGALDVLEAARAEGHGVLFASAHLGPWERVAAALVGCGVPLVVVARESYDPRLTRIYDALRARLGVTAIYRGGPTAGIRIVRALRRGAVLGVPMDLKTRVPSVDVPFLGLRAPTATGPARLALRTGAAVVVGSVERRQGTLVVTAMRLRTCEASRARGPVSALTERINDELSRRILTAPDEWPWMHDRFCAPPDARAGAQSKRPCVLSDSDGAPRESFQST